MMLCRRLPLKQTYANNIKHRIININTKSICLLPHISIGNNGREDTTRYNIERFPIRSYSASSLKKEEESKPQSSSIILGIVLSTATACAGFGLASFISSSISIPLSGIPTSILLGMAINNTIGYNKDMFKSGITYSTKTILQTGIVCVAAKLYHSLN